MTKLDFPSEKILEDYIFENITKYGDCPISGYEAFLSFRQFNLGAYGIPDIVKMVSRNDCMEITVLELKVEPLKPAHLAQLCRYVTGMNELVGKYKKHLNIKVFGELAGPLELGNDLVFLADHVGHNITIHDLSLSMDDGLVSEQVPRGWTKTGSDAADKNLSKRIYQAFVAYNKIGNAGSK